MNKTNRKVPLSFAPETRFPVTPVAAPAPFLATETNDLERLKERLLREALAQTDNVNLYAPLRRAVNDATALAWTTGFPLLTLPALFEEKALAARRHTARQQAIHARTQALMEVA